MKRQTTLASSRRPFAFLETPFRRYCGSGKNGAMKAGMGMQASRSSKSRESVTFEHTYGAPWLKSLVEEGFVGKA